MTDQAINEHALACASRVHPVLKLEKVTESGGAANGNNGSAVSKAYCDAAAQMLVDDVSDNEAIGKFGAEWIVEKAGGGQVSVLTHCNTG